MDADREEDVAPCQELLLRVFRHGPKLPDGNADPAGLQLIREKVSLAQRDRPYRLIFYSKVIPSRTFAYAQATISAPCCAGNCLLSPHGFDSLGSNSWMTDILIPEFKTMTGAGNTNLQAIDHVFSNRQINLWEIRAGAGIFNCFSAMMNHLVDTAMAWSHDPFVSLAARHYGWSDAQSLPEFGYVDFVMNKGVIGVVIS